MRPLLPRAALALTLTLACTPGPSETTTEGTTTDGTSTETGTATGTWPEAMCEDHNEIAAETNVTMTVTNNGAETLYLVTEGSMCPAIGIERNGENGYEEVLNNTYDPCPCGCPGAPTGPAALVALAPAASHELVWDGRRVATCQHTIECYDEPPQSGTNTKFVRQPVEPGDYRVSIGYFTALPEDCSEGSPGEYSCTASPGGSAVCGADGGASVELTLGADDLAVELALP